MTKNQPFPTQRNSINWFKAVILAGCIFLPALTTSTYASPKDLIKSEQQAQASVNINLASAEQIAASLKGIGIKKARTIVQYRQDFGNIKSLEQLEEVKGIGKAIVKRNANRIQF